MKTIYELKLNEEIRINDSKFVMRVPGGWIYSETMETGTDGNNIANCFVPFHNEFQIPQDSQ